MRERIHKRLPVEFVQEVFDSFNRHRISEKEAMDLLGIKRSRLHQLRKKWLLRSKRRPFGWLRGRFNFAFLAEEAQKRFDRLSVAIASIFML
jgi:hypothetical protein